jgi:1-acyl-sn-glycerol-3-phosphate acyltransferase
MKVAVLGFDGPVSRSLRSELERQGHQVADDAKDCVVYLPGSEEELRRLVERGGYQRLVLRSHAYAYGSNPKNPGLMTEERISLLPENVPEQRWLRMEEIASRHPNAVIVRLTNVLDVAEGDLVVRELAGRHGRALAGHDPSVQFISVEDAGGALAAAARSTARGIFNAAGPGTIPLKKAFLASGTRRRPHLLPFAKDLLALQYNWTISSARAERELGWTARRSTIEALADWVREKPGANLALLREPYDPWGLDIDYIRAWGWWLNFLRRIYWRIEAEGLANIPSSGRAMLVSNHRGFMPLDAVMHLWVVFTGRGRVCRFLIIHSLLRIPFLCNFLTKLGGVIASQENAERLFASEALVGIFPEGIRGTFTPYKHTYKLRDFTKTGFAKIAIENRTPVIPVAVVGHAEIFPIIARIDSTFVTKVTGWPYFPIAPMFPLAPVPIPSKWHMRVLPAVPVDHLRREDSDNPRVIKAFSRYVQRILQVNIDQMVARRKGIFHGRVLDGTAPEQPSPPQFRTATGDAQ